MNTNEQFLVEKVLKKSAKKVYLMSEKEKQRKRVYLLNDMECFALFHFNFTNQNQAVSVSSTVKVVNVGNYHNYIKRDLGNPNFSPSNIVIPLFS